MTPPRLSPAAYRCTVFSHPDCYRHEPGESHPDSPERLRIVEHALQAASIDRLGWRHGTIAAREAIESVHDREYVDGLEAVASSMRNRWNLDKDTIISKSSWLAARTAAGVVCAAVDAVLAEETRNAFCLVRPPGHHAERRHALGFCILNNIAIAAQRARIRHGLERLAIIDIDAHHGNGAQNIFWDDPNVFLASIHQGRLSFETGDADEHGAHGTIHNYPLPARAGSDEFRAALRDLLTRASDFKPQILFVAAGFDGHARDPLSELLFTEQDFDFAGGTLAAAADSSCGGRLVASLEGGYNPESLARSSVAFVQGLAR